MADVPDDAVSRRIENIVQRHGQFDHAETGAQMPAGHRHRADRLGAQFLGDLGEVVLAELAQIGGRVDLIEQWRVRFRHFIPKGAARPQLGARKEADLHQVRRLPQLRHLRAQSLVKSDRTAEEGQVNRTQSAKFPRLLKRKSGLCLPCRRSACLAIARARSASTYCEGLPNSLGGSRRPSPRPSDTPLRLAIAGPRRKVAP